MSETKSIDTIEPRDQTETTIDLEPRSTMRGTLFRIISTLDAEIHVTLEATDGIDGTSFGESESLPIGGETGDPGDDTKQIAAGDSTKQVESVLLEEHWPHLRFGVTAQSNPTAGDVEVREVKNF